MIAIIMKLPLTIDPAEKRPTPTVRVVPPSSLLPLRGIESDYRFRLSFETRGSQDR